jgi:hypothetical protein
LYVEAAGILSRIESLVNGNASTALTLKHVEVQFLKHSEDDEELVALKHSVIVTGVQSESIGMHIQKALVRTMNDKISDFSWHTLTLHSIIESWMALLTKLRKQLSLSNLNNYDAKTLCKCASFFEMKLDSTDLLKAKKIIGDGNLKCT